MRAGIPPSPFSPRLYRSATRAGAKSPYNHRFFCVHRLQHQLAILSFARRATISSWSSSAGSANFGCVIGIAPAWHSQAHKLSQHDGQHASGQPRWMR